ncbi:aminotransferase class I/II-fold pyridoxal phosphate-dependent enzyme [Puniceicoccaceae bacterium K14]|nr:aminotransferase class I/II-fold pyridoxal phosphate-dependent enzyme [Puniceicoccaceae bacterium K14]
MSKISIYQKSMRSGLMSVLGGIALSFSLSAEPAPTLKDSLIRLSSNENAFGYSPKAQAAIVEALDGGSYYNRNDVADLVELLAEKEGVPSDHILTTAGSGPLLMMTAIAYADPEKNVVTTEMGYTQLIRKYDEMGGQIKYASLSEDMGYDFEAMSDAIDENTVIVYICNPNNPTGVLADPIELKKFILSVPKDILVFVDEAYLELTDKNFGMLTIAPMAKSLDNVIVTRTFSKAYGLAGFRVGYAVASPKIIDTIKPYYMGPPSFIAAIAAQEAVKDMDHMIYNVEAYQKTRAYVCDKFDAMGITYAKPQGAFIYFKTGIDQQELRDSMKEKGILISGSRESGVIPGKYQAWARVSIGTQTQMDLFLDTLSQLMVKG